MSREGYSEQERNTIIVMYQERGNDGLQEISDIIGKSVNSVRAKLVKEKIYVAPEKKINQRKNGLSKKEIIRELGGLGLAPEGLDGTTKLGLNNIKKLIEELKGK